MPRADPDKILVRVGSWYQKASHTRFVTSKMPPPKNGRPRTTGPGEPQVVRMHAEQLAAIDAWIRAAGEDISRPEAIRRLVELGLKMRK